MAINNGNSDFGLSVSKTGTKSLKITWSKKDGIGYNGSITVQRPGDGKEIYSKTYNQSVASDSLTVEVPYFGEYKVHIKANNGYTYDTAYCKVHLDTTTSTTYTFTKEDVTKWKLEASATLVVFAALGFCAWVQVTVGAAVISVGAGLRDIWVKDTKYEPFPTPSEGDKITTKIEATSTGVKTTLTYLPKNGATITPKVTTAVYLTFPR